MEKALEINTWLWQYGGEAMQYIWKSNNDKGSSHVLLLVLCVVTNDHHISPAHNRIPEHSLEN